MCHPPGGRGGRRERGEGGRSEGREAEGGVKEERVGRVRERVRKKGGSKGEREVKVKTLCKRCVTRHHGYIAAATMRCAASSLTSTVKAPALHSFTFLGFFKGGP